MIALITSLAYRKPQVAWWFVLAFCVFWWLFGLSIAQAAHCRKGQLYRVSMHRCVQATSRLGREIRPHRRGRYARLEEREVRSRHVRPHARRKVIAETPSAERPEKPDWFVEILIPDDGSLRLDDEAAKTPEPKPAESQTPNPRWPPNWADWYAPR